MSRYCTCSKSVYCKLLTPNAALWLSLPHVLLQVCKPCTLPSVKSEEGHAISSAAQWVLSNYGAGLASALDVTPPQHPRANILSLELQKQAEFGPYRM